MARLYEANGKKILTYMKREYLMDIPNLIDVQLSSYNEFIQANVPPKDRKRQGLQEVFLEVFPIQDFTGNLILEYVEYRLGLPRCKKCPGTEGSEKKECLYFECPYDKVRECTFAEIDGVPFRVKYDTNECKKRDVTYGVPLTLVVRLINKLSGEVKEQEIFLVNFPIISERGTFVINGAERVVVSQLHRSPGIYYKYDKVNKLYASKIIPYRGAWLEAELDVIKDTIMVRIDRKRKQPVTVLFKALGYSTEEILEAFDNNIYIKKTLEIDKTAEIARTEKLSEQAAALKDVYSKLRPGEPFTEENASILLNQLFFDPRKYDLASVGRFKLNKKFRLSERIVGRTVGETVIKLSTGEILAEPGETINHELARQIEEAGLKSIKVITLDGEELVVHSEPDWEEILFRDKEAFRKALIGKTTAETIVKPNTGEVLFKVNTIITPEIAKKINKNRIDRVKVYTQDGNIIEMHRSQYEFLTPEDETVLKKKIEGRVLVADVYHPKLKKDGNPVLIAKKGDELTEDLLRKIREAEVESILVKKGRILTKSDIFASIRYLIDLANGLGHVDDIDHLGNRRIRRSGELLQNQFRMALLRMERDIKERMTLQDTSQVSSQTLINTRPVAAMIKDFFGSSQLSQFMDQHNPLSELTHRRRISALGPGGVRRERAGYEVRDVHPTHYGRLCPIETPEGPNAGLISSLALCASVNEHGFLEAPFRRVKNRKLTDEIVYLDAYEEDAYKVTPVDIEVDYKTKTIIPKMVTAKYVRDGEHEFGMIPAEEVDLQTVSPYQMVSVGSALIPFLEHDDANRALMGTNMQRQAVPLIKTEEPIVGTGLEHRVAIDSGVMICARQDGRVVQVDADHIKVETKMKSYADALVDHVLIEPLFDAGGKELYPARTRITPEIARDIEKKGFYKLRVETVDGEEVVIDRKEYGEGKTQYDIYNLKKFKRSNQGTCINQKVCVREGDYVKKGQVLADGPSTKNGELSLGRNITAVFMPWEGYNFEDAILISERLVKDDVYTSIHLEEYEIETRDTRLGVEEITRDIPNISAEALRNLDEEGIVRIGAEVQSGDILVGKVTPKGETELTAEDKLLRAIFGEKAREVRNTSFVVPHGEGGKVVDVMVFSRDNKDELPHGVNKLVRVFIAQKRKITEGDKMAGRHGNKGVIAKILPEADMPFLEDGTPCDIVLNPLGVPSRMNLGQVFETHLGMIGKVLGLKIESPIFDGATEEEVRDGLVVARIVSDRLLAVYSQTGQKIANIRFAHADRDRIREQFVKEGIRSVIARLISEGEASLFDASNQYPLGVFKKMEYSKVLEKIESGDISSLVEFDGVVEIRGDVKPLYMVVASEGEDGKVSYEKKSSEEAERNFQKEIRVLTLSDTERENLKKALSNVDFTKHETGKVRVFDGRTGEPFDNNATVGNIYMMKLAHLVDDKIHARATGPYSLVTQQPLGGKAQFGGQRFGEMEVWALEAYGVAHCLQELLTVKSDDVEGRVEVYEAIIKGENVIKPSIPESFKVLVSELQSLGLKVELLKLPEGAKETAGELEEFGGSFDSVVPTTVARRRRRRHLDDDDFEPDFMEEEEDSIIEDKDDIDMPEELDLDMVDDEDEPLLGDEENPEED